jgi:PAS domain S-box-containing protein
MENERRFNYAERVANIGSWEIDISSNKCIWSDQFFRICGFESDSFEPTYEIWLSIIHPEDRAHAASVIKKAIQEKEPYSIETRIVRPDGCVVWVACKGEVICNSKGEAVKLVGAFLDLTERKYLEAVLRKNEKNYRKLFENMTAGFTLHEIIYDENTDPIDYHFLEVNPVFEQLIGISKSRLLGRSVREVLLETDPSLIDFYDQVVRMGEPGSYENYSRKTGECYHIWAYSPSRDRLAVLFTDAAGRAPNNAGSDRSEALFRQILENVDEVFWVRDFTTRRIEYISPAYEQVWGRSRQSLYDHPESLTESVHPDDSTRVAEAIKKQAKGRPLNEQYRILRPDGEIRWVGVRSHLVYDENGLASRIVGTAEDITERKQSEEALRALNFELEQHAQEKTTLLDNSKKELETFAYSVSHDLRAPLRRIDGYSQVLLEDHSPNLNGEILDYLHKIRSATTYMSELIENFLRLSKISFVETTIEQVDLSQIAKEIIATMADAYKGRQASFIIAPKIIAKGDKDLLRIALENLFSNAWKFTSKISEAKIEFGIFGCGDPVYFIRDNGVGFDCSKANRLFEPFQRMHTQKDYEGTGIGLAIVKRVIERHGGHIWVESQVGQGTTFWFSL